MTPQWQEIKEQLFGELDMTQDIPDEENRMISCRVYIKNDKLCLDIRNTFAKKPVFNNGIPISSRPGHGLGVKSILSIVEKHGGVLSPDYDGKVTISISGDAKELDDAVNGIYADFSQLEQDMGINLDDYLNQDWDVRLQAGFKDIQNTIDQYQEIYDKAAEAEITANETYSAALQKMQDANTQIQEAMASGNKEKMQQAFEAFDAAKVNLQPILDDANTEESVRELLQGYIDEIEESSSTSLG